MGRILRVKVGVGVRDIDGSCLRQKPPSRGIMQSFGWYGEAVTVQFSTCLFFFSHQIPSFQWNRKRCSSRWLCLGRLREVWWHLATAAYVPRLLGASSWGVCSEKMISIANSLAQIHEKKQNKRVFSFQGFPFIKWLNFRISYPSTLFCGLWFFMKVRLPKEKHPPKKTTTLIWGASWYSWLNGVQRFHLSSACEKKQTRDDGGGDGGAEGGWFRLVGEMLIFDEMFWL